MKYILNEHWEINGYDDKNCPIYISVCDGGTALNELTGACEGKVINGLIVNIV